MANGNLSKVGILVGLILIVIPEPATTMTGALLVTASTGVNLADAGTGGAATTAEV